MHSAEEGPQHARARAQRETAHHVVEDHGEVGLLLGGKLVDQRAAVRQHRHAVYSTSRIATPCTQLHAPPRRTVNVTHRYAARQATAKASRARERSACAAAGSPSGRQPRARSRASADASGRPAGLRRQIWRVRLFVCLLARSFVRSFADARRLRSRLCVAARGLVGGYAHCVLSAARGLRLVVRCTSPAGGRDGDELQPTNACAGTDSAHICAGTDSAHICAGTDSAHICARTRRTSAPGLARPTSAPGPTGPHLRRD